MIVAPNEIASHAVFGNYSLPHLLRVLPQLVILTVVSMVADLVRGRFRRVGAVADAWAWNLRHVGSIVAKRKRPRSLRKVPDADLRRFQQPGLARLAMAMRGRSRQRRSRGRDTVMSASAATNWAVVASWGVAFGLLVVASRSLISERVPVVGRLVPQLGGARELISQYVSGWRPHGLGQTAPSPTSVGLMGVLTLLVGGREGATRLLATVGPVVLGWFGMWALTRPLANPRARLVSLATYALIPLVGLSFTSARWSGLVLYGAAPWVLWTLARSSGIAPYGEPFGWPRRLVPMLAARLAIVLGLASAFAPSILVGTVVMAVTFLIGLLATGGRQAARRVAGTVAFGVGGALALHLPWAITGGGIWASWSDRPVDSTSLASILRFDPLADRWWLSGWLVVLAGALSVALAGGWRLAWAVRFACRARWWLPDRMADRDRSRAIWFG